jgi:hypothetical protein
MSHLQEELVAFETDDLTARYLLTRAKEDLDDLETRIADFERRMAEKDRAIDELHVKFNFLASLVGWLRWFKRFPKVYAIFHVIREGQDLCNAQSRD